jgi:hypothetical protein
MCGATHEQKDLQAKQAAFYDDLRAEQKVVFGKHQAILDKLTEIFMPILEKGPSQRGFADAESTALKTQALESTTRNYQHASETLEEQLAARGGSDFVPSGADAELRADLAARGAQARTDLDSQIEVADWEAGRKNWSAAAGVLGGVATELNPNATANSATGAGSAAGETANQIAQASNSIWGSVIGGISGIAGQAVGGWASKQSAPPSDNG